MIPLKRIFTIEPTAACNLECEYCINRLLRRPRAHMSWETFLHALDWLGALRNGAPEEAEIALTGCGECFLNPRMVDMVRETRDRFPKAYITISTNGTLITSELCERLRPYNPAVYVSMHNPLAGQQASTKLAEAGLLVISNEAFHTSSFDWAGQVDWPVTAPPIPCIFLAEGRGCVLSDGSITRCCMDAQGIGTMGNVNEPIRPLQHGPFELCNRCHMLMPEGVA